MKFVVLCVSFLFCCSSWGSDYLCANSTRYTLIGKSRFIQVLSSQKIKPASGLSNLLLEVYFETTKWISDSALRGNTRARTINILFLTEDEFHKIASIAPGSHAQSMGFVTDAAKTKCGEDNIYISFSVEARSGFFSERILRLFSHELYHLLYQYKCSACSNPLWFDEGMAEYIATLSTQIIPQKALTALYASREKVLFEEADAQKFKDENYAYAYLFFIHYYGRAPDIIEIKNIINSPDPVFHIARTKGFSGDRSTAVNLLLRSLPAPNDI